MDADIPGSGAFRKLAIHHAHAAEGGALFVRVWRARTSPSKESSYTDTVRREVLPHLRSSPGYRRSSFLRRRLDDGSVEILVLTYWDSRAAAGGLANGNADGEMPAWVPDEIGRTLDHQDDVVLLYETLLEDGSGGGISEDTATATGDPPS